MKVQKEKLNTKSREESIRDMIQREKVKNSVFKIQKSPNSKNSQKLIRDLQIDTSIPRSKSIFVRRNNKRNLSSSQRSLDRN